MITALALALLFQVQEIQEQEPNDTGAAAHQEIAPGGTFVGSAPEGDQDWLWLTCAEDSLCDLSLEPGEGGSVRLEILIGERSFVTREGYEPAQMLRFRFPKGRTAVHVSGNCARYRLRAVSVVGETHDECEPNDREEDAIPIREGETWRCRESGHQNDHDFFALQVGKDGPRELVVRRDRRREHPVRGVLSLNQQGSDRVQFAYGVTPVADEFHFYPVLSEGIWYADFMLFGDSGAGETYELTVLPFSAQVGAEELTAARAAIERATQYLLKIPEERHPIERDIAAESMALAALSEGAGASARREQLERDFVAWITDRFGKVEGGSWRGHDVHRASENIYAHAMAVLGLAEAAANGSDKAREFATRGAEFLIATQNTERKPACWKGPIARDARGYGGWRYSPDDDTADLSILGWCVVALTAADAAGIRVDGTRDAIPAALTYLGRVGNEQGFGYEFGGTRLNLHNSIAALLLLLYDEQAQGFSFAQQQLDTHLWSATQVDTGDGYAFYYLYYAARAQYLRGGEAWKPWRAVVLRQLLRRQEADGSWASFDAEDQVGPRWTTAIGLMMLRLCLNEAPRYLRPEVRGF